jgi:hypothetical protein
VQLTFTTTGQSAPCAAATKNVTATINPAATANANNPAAVCASSPAIQVVGTYGGGATGGEWSGGAGSFGTQVKDATAKTITATYTPTADEIAAGTVQLTFTTTGQSAPCAAATKNVTATITPNPAAPAVEYIGPSCTETTFKVEVTSPVAGTYMLRQMMGGVAPISKTYPDDAVGGKIVFEGLTIGKGYSVTHTANNCTSEAEECGDFNGGYQAASSGRQSSVIDQEIVLKNIQKANVTAAPNPFNDRIRFTLKSDVSGQGTLELYNTLGQKVKTVFQGQVKAGQVQTIEYAVPSAQRTNLIYLFRVGDQTATGKLVGLKQ